MANEDYLPLHQRLARGIDVSAQTKGDKLRESSTNTGSSGKFDEMESSMHGHDSVESHWPSSHRGGHTEQD